MKKCIVCLIAAGLAASVLLLPHLHAETATLQPVKKSADTLIAKNHGSAEINNELAKTEALIAQTQQEISIVQKAFQSELERNGYQTVGKSFKIVFKNIWTLDFSNKMYLDGKRLPDPLTEDVIRIYSSIVGSKRALSALQISFPDGLDKEITIRR